MLRTPTLPPACLCRITLICCPFRLHTDAYLTHTHTHNSSMVYLALPQWNALHVIVCYNHHSTCTECFLHSPCTNNNHAERVPGGMLEEHKATCTAPNAWQTMTVGTQLSTTHTGSVIVSKRYTHTSEAASMSHHAHPTPTCSHPRRWHWATLPPLCLSLTFFASPPLHCKSKSQPTQHDNNTHHRALPHYNSHGFDATDLTIDTLATTITPMATPREPPSR